MNDVSPARNAAWSAGERVATAWPTRPANAEGMYSLIATVRCSEWS
jgi:hypothetical protein